MLRFLAPSMLWALAGLAVPLVVHLLGRGERRRIPFANVEWLVSRPAMRGLRFAPSDPALLAARCALLTLLALALAQPSCSGGLPDPSTGKVHVLDAAVEADPWGALRAADRDLPPGDSIRVEGEAQVEALRGSRPVVAREVSWVAAARPATGVASSNQTAGSPTTTAQRSLRYAIDATSAAAPAAATWRGWVEGLAEVLGLAAEEVTVEGQPDLLIRVAEGTSDLVVSGGMAVVLVPASGEPGAAEVATLQPPLAPLAFELKARPLDLDLDPERSRAVARDGRGRAVVTVERTREGELWRFAIPITLEASSLSRNEAWIELGWAILKPLAERRLAVRFPSPRDERVLPAALALPVSTGRSTPPSTARSTPAAIAWFAVLALALVERWLAARRAAA